MAKKVLYVATVLSHICQFHLPYLKMFQEQGYEVYVAARDNLAEKNGLQLKYTDKLFEIPFERSPFSTKNIKAYKLLKNIINSERYDFIVCNTPVGGIVTRLAAKKARKKGTKVVYVAHGFHFYKGAPKKNWLVYYPIEKCFAKRCDILVTITKEDYAFALKKFKTKVEHIHGIGVSEQRYHVVDENSRRIMRETEGVTQDDFLLLCTGELNKNKDQTTLIRAASALKDKIPNLKIFLAGNGPLEKELKEQVDSCDLNNVIKFLGYRTDLEKIVPSVDLVVSCSHREGLPLNIIEAMLCRKPIVASINRGHSELIEDGVNGYLFRPCDWELLADRIFKIYKMDNREEMGEKSYRIVQDYTVNAVETEIKELFGL